MSSKLSRKFKIMRGLSLCLGGDSYGLIRRSKDAYVNDSGGSAIHRLYGVMIFSTFIGVTYRPKGNN